MRPMMWWTQIRELREQLKNTQRELEAEQGQMSRLAGHLARLQAVSVAIDKPFPARELADAAVDALTGLLGAEQAIFLTLDSATQDFLPLAARGFTPQVLSTLRLSQPEGLKKYLAAGGLIQPLNALGRVVGLVAAGRPAGPVFNDQDKTSFGLVARQAAFLYGQDQLVRQAAVLRKEAVEALARALGAKDSYTHLHARRTRMLTRAVAQELQLPEALIAQMEEGALLHDIGKIGIDDAILKKPDSLTPEEMTLMRTHARQGRDILEPIPSLANVSAIVLYHQEWYNGTGYPDGLAGEEIPLGARVVQILDAWDAMTSDRPYRKALPKAQAVAELRRQAGTQFDPKLVEVFLRVVGRLEREGVPTTEK